MPTESGLRLFVDGMMQVAEPSAEERAAIEARIDRDGPIEEALAAATRGAVRAFGLRRHRPGAEARAGAARSSASCRLSPDQALAVLVGGDGSVENRVVDLPPGVAPSRAGRGGQLCQRAPLRPDAEPGADAAARGDRPGEAALDTAAQELVDARPRHLVARMARGRC